MANVALSSTRMSAGLALASLLAGQAAAYDMRSCPLDALTFVNPWSEAEFQPNRVGVKLYYACGPEEKIVTSPTDTADCTGPFGELMLEGIFADNGQETRLLAMYTVYKGTSPCCGWSVFAPGEEPEIEARAVWLDQGAAPRLGEWPFASIENDWGTRDDMDGVVALICDPALG